MNSSHHKIFKCIDFAPNYYNSAINLNATSSFNVFS